MVKRPKEEGFRFALSILLFYVVDLEVVIGAVDCVENLESFRFSADWPRFFFSNRSVERLWRNVQRIFFFHSLWNSRCGMWRKLWKKFAGKKRGVLYFLPVFSVSYIP